MDTEAFLRHVLPETGPYCIAKQVKFKDGRQAPKHFWADSIADAAFVAHREDNAGYDTYFAVGTLIKKQNWEIHLDRNKQPYKEPDGLPAYWWTTHRTAKNIRGLRSYIIDIDVGFKDDGTPRGYDTEELALEALVAFCKHYRLPQPTVVRSGSGLHIYFTLEAEVETTTWKANGLRIKEMAAAVGFKIDPDRTGDVASILRVVGCHNFKYSPPPVVEVLYVGEHTPVDMFHGLLGLHDNTVSASNFLTGTPLVEFDKENTGAQEKERACLDFPGLLNVCQVFRKACDPDTRDSTPEPVWHYVIMLTRLCGSPEQGKRLSHQISQGDPRYSAAQLDAKLARLEEGKFGPATCVKIRGSVKTGEDICAGCPHYDKITSPAQLAHYMAPSEPLTVEEEYDDGTVDEVVVSDPPPPFVRRDGKIAIQQGTTQGKTETVFCECDMYPVRLQYDEKTKLEEEVVWNINMPHEGWIQLGIPHCSKNQLATILHKRGIRIRNADIDLMEWFMTAYVRKLQAETPREVTYSKQGWRKDGSFIVGDTLFKRNGDIETHAMGNSLKQDTNNAMVVAGTLEDWKKATRPYTRPGLEHNRVYMYASLASAIFCFTNQIATFISATGEGGVGKSTLMEVCAAMWGDPQLLMARGAEKGSTIAALEAHTNAMHNLPIYLDEITDRNVEDMAKFIFNYSGGKGKMRSQASGGVRPDTATWGNIAMVNANADEYARMSSVYKDSQPHMMRFLQIEFPVQNIISKPEGDEIKALVYENFGHAGRIFIEYIVQHQASVKTRVQQYVRDADKRTGGNSAERFWIAGIACMRCAAEIGYDLGLFENFPIPHDIEWLYTLALSLRTQVQQFIMSADEMISEFLDHELTHTLTIGAKNSGNVDNIREEPRGGLTVRKEEDTDRTYISRSALQTYCVDRNINMGRHLKTLFTTGVVLQENMRRVLGAGTVFAKGNVRCIEVDTKVLQGRLHSVKPHAAPAVGNIARAAP